MKKLTIVILIVLAISAIACGVTAFATGRSSADDKVEQTSVVDQIAVEKFKGYDLNTWSVSENTDNIEYVDIFNKEKLDLKYSYTMHLTDQDDKLAYVDDKENTYFFNSKNECVGYTLNSTDYMFIVDWYKSKSEDMLNSICAEDAITLGEQAAKEFMGERYDHFKLISVTPDANNTCYSLHYSCMLGEEKAIEGAYAYVEVLHDGTVSSFSMNNFYETLNFDESRLNGITVSFLEEKALEKLKELYDRDFVRAEVKNLVLFCDDGKYYIRFNATGYMNDLDIIEVGKLRDPKLLPIGETLTYDIP